MSKKEKQLLRQDMGRILSNLDERWTRVASNELSTRLSQLLEQQQSELEINHILAWSGAHSGQPQLECFIEQQLGQRDLYFPKFYEDGRTDYFKLDVHLFRTVKQIDKALLKEVEFDEADAAQTMMIIPGMSFDLSGNRLGWGELHYERFLSNSRLKSLMKVGIAWSMQMVKEVPVESTDLIMDWIVTERETYNTSVQFS